jgi:hypothetical protein
MKTDPIMLRETTMMHLMQGGASIQDVIDVIEKLHKADGVEYDINDIERDVTQYYEIYLENKGIGKPSVLSQVEEWLVRNKCNTDVAGLLRVSLRDCYTDLNLQSKIEKSACRVAFQRLCQKGKMEPLGLGIYRYKNGASNEIDYMAADETPFDWRCPLNTHELVNVFPKSIVIIAGESNSGKTAYLLNVARKYMKERPVYYYSSEMEDVELKVRLKNFNKPLIDWANVRFIERSSNFHEVMQPDGINIIDYLEVHKDFYEVSGLIRQIRDKLNKGIAIIAIQKPKGRDEAVGGQGTKNLARLYISLSPGRAKIVKGKMWKTFMNPDNLCINFSLGGGANFKIDNTWCKSEEDEKPISGRFRQ